MLNTFKRRKEEEHESNASNESNVLDVGTIADELYNAIKRTIDHGVKEGNLNIYKTKYLDPETNPLKVIRNDYKENNFKKKASIDVSISVPTLEKNALILSMTIRPGVVNYVKGRYESITTPVTNRNDLQRLSNGIAEYIKTVKMYHYQ